MNGTGIAYRFEFDLGGSTNIAIKRDVNRISLILIVQIWDFRIIIVRIYCNPESCHVWISFGFCRVAFVGEHNRSSWRYVFFLFCFVLFCFVCFVLFCFCFCFCSFCLICIWQHCVLYRADQILLRHCTSLFAAAWRGHIWPYTGYCPSNKRKGFVGQQNRQKSPPYCGNFGYGPRFYAFLRLSVAYFFVNKTASLDYTCISTPDGIIEPDEVQEVWFRFWGVTPSPSYIVRASYIIAQVQDLQCLNKRWRRT